LPAFDQEERENGGCVAIQVRFFASSMAEAKATGAPLLGTIRGCFASEKPYRLGAERLYLLLVLM
jgi:hypothetical protein